MAIKMQHRATLKTLNAINFVNHAVKICHMEG